MVRKEVNIEELLRLHKTGLSDSALAQHFTVSRQVIRQRREQLGLHSNKSRHKPTGKSRAIINFLELHKGCEDLRVVRTAFGIKEYHATQLSRQIKILHGAGSRHAVLYLAGYRTPARTKLEELVRGPLAEHIIEQGGVVEWPKFKSAR